MMKKGKKKVRKGEMNSIHFKLNIFIPISYTRVYF